MRLTIGLRILLWFAKNSDEELTTKDVMHKFGVNYETARSSLNTLVRNKLLEKTSVKKTHNNVHFNVFSAGQLLK